MHRRAPSLLLVTSLAACSTPVAQSPSLAPRSAEAIDPRVPIPNNVPSGAVSPGLVSRLADLVNQAQVGDSAFREAAATAQRLATAAGPAHSESWVAAQQAISTAQAARAPTSRALGDIDALAASAILSRGGIAPADLSAIKAAQAKVGAIDNSQTAMIGALQARLGS